MPEELKKCPLCGSTRHSVIDQRTFKGRQVINRLCHQCGLVFQSPRMTKAEADAFYAGAYRKLYQDSEKPVIKDLLVQRARAAALTDFVRPLLPNVQRYLDIGASAGELVRQIKAAYPGAEVFGVEPGNAYRSYAASFGLTFAPDLDTLLQQISQPFDLVSMSHVLEHLADPITYLARLRNVVLAPNGYLLLEVPNLYGHTSFEIAHNFSFSAHTLRQLLYQSGYRIIKMETHGRPRSDLIPLYITALVQAAPHYADKTVEGEHNVVLKRWLAMLRRRVLLRFFRRRAWKEI